MTTLIDKKTENVKTAYKLFEQDVYYNRADLYLRKQLAEFEKCENLENKLEKQI